MTSLRTRTLLAAVAGVLATACGAAVDTVVVVVVVAAVGRSASCACMSSTDRLRDAFRPPITGGDIMPLAAADASPPNRDVTTGVGTSDRLSRLLAVGDGCTDVGVASPLATAAGAAGRDAGTSDTADATAANRDADAQAAGTSTSAGTSSCRAICSDADPTLVAG